MRLINSRAFSKMNGPRSESKEIIYRRFMKLIFAFSESFLSFILLMTDDFSNYIPLHSIDKLIKFNLFDALYRLYTRCQLAMIHLKESSIFVKVFGKFCKMILFIRILFIDVDIHSTLIKKKIPFLFVDSIFSLFSSRFFSERI